MPAAHNMDDRHVSDGVVFSHSSPPAESIVDDVVPAALESLEDSDEMYDSDMADDSDEQIFRMTWTKTYSRGRPSMTTLAT